MLLAGCDTTSSKPPPIIPKHPDLGPKANVPAFLHGSIYERVELGNTEPYPVSSYGLVVNLANTGDTTAPQAVREYISKEMYKHGFGQTTTGYKLVSPDRVLRDKSVAIVQVVGMLPPGVREGQSFDVYVSCLPNNRTTSLAGGKLYLTELKKDGANPRNPFGAVNVFGNAKGFIFVNPVYAMNHEPVPRGPAAASLRNGVILDGGLAVKDRPLFLQLRQPQSSVSRAIELRLTERFQNTHVAQAQDEGLVQIYVPARYGTDWEHFARLAMHVFLDSSPEFETIRSQQLLMEARKPDAPLEDISYCWEAIGARALNATAAVLADKNSPPELTFAAARAAAYIGDPTGAAPAALVQMARDATSPFQLNAVQTLGALPPSSTVNHMLRTLLDSDKSSIRIAAYQTLARNHDTSIVQSEVVTPREDHQKFVLDVVPCGGPPLIFATRSGIPRLAIIGTMPEITTPVMFSAMENRLTISSTSFGDNITIYYRPPTPQSDTQVDDARAPKPVKMVSSTDIAQVVRRLGGWLTEEDDRPLDFSYSEVLAILQRLSDERRLVSWHEGQSTAANFVLQEPPRLTPQDLNGPSPDNSRPQGEAKAQTASGHAG